MITGFVGLNKGDKKILILFHNEKGNRKIFSLEEELKRFIMKFFNGCEYEK